MQITAQHVHSRNWIKCPRCFGEKLPAGWMCGSCDNSGEVPRHSRAKHTPVDSDYYERQIGA